MRFRRRLVQCLSAASVAALALTACSSSGKTTGSSSTSSGGSTPTAGTESSASAPSTSASAAAPSSSGAGVSNAAAKAALDSVCKAGASEGTVQAWLNFRSSADIIADFNKDYPDVKVQVLKITPEDAVPRIVTAVAAGKSADVDVIYGGPSSLDPLRQRNILASDVDWTKFGIDKNNVLDGNTQVVFAQDAFGLGYNTNKWKPADLPDTWDGLIDKKYSGEVVIDPRGRPFEYLSVLWGTDKTVDYVKKLISTDHTLVVSGSTAGLQSIARGEGSLLVQDAVSYTQIQQAKGAPVDIKLLTPVPMSSFATAEIASTKRPNASQCLVAWFASASGEKSIDAHDQKNFATADKLRSAGTEISIAKTPEDVAVLEATIDKLVPIIAQNK